MSLLDDLADLSRRLDSDEIEAGGRYLMVFGVGLHTGLDGRVLHEWNWGRGEPVFGPPRDVWDWMARRVAAVRASSG